MLKATLAARSVSRHTASKTGPSRAYSANITARIQSGTIRIWQNGKVIIRLYDYTRDPEASPPPSEEAITATLASLTQILTAQAIAIGATVQVTDTASSATTWF